MTVPTISVSIIILAAHKLPQLGWQALLNAQPGLDVWATAANLDDFQALPDTGGKTAVLLDDATLSSNQLSHLTQTQPEYGYLYLVNEYDLTQIVSLLQAGIPGVLNRDATLPELIQALIAVSRGEIVLPPTLAARALTALARGEMKPKTSSIEPLTNREQEVLTFLAQGLTNKDIAQTLFLSVRTVEAHLRNIYSKLDVNSRTEAVLWAVQHGYES